MTRHSKDENKVSNLVICLFSFESKNNNEYKELLSKFNVQVVEIENEEQCQSVLHTTKCNGILIDIPTFIKSSIYIKELMSNIENIYPAARIRYCKENNEMELTILSKRSQVSLLEFLETYCANFDARILRRYKRVPLNLNLRLSCKHKGTLRTTVNISEGGFFIVDKASGWHISDKVKIQILELSEIHFLHGTIVRKLEWGEKHFHAPGFGIRIDSIDKEIHEDFIKLTQKY